MDISPNAIELTPPEASDRRDAANSAPYGKWGHTLNAGFQLLPDVLLKHQGRLHLSATDVVVLINLTMSWWFPERLPFPRPTTIAKRMGTGVRTVQRSLQRLEDRGLVTRVRLRSSESPGSIAFDLSGLVRELKDLAESDPGYRERFIVPRAVQIGEFD